ncbi:MAG: hypothetical protein PVG53_08360 [Holophagae bacterium]|jgi:hypothetical protein
MEPGDGMSGRVISVALAAALVLSCGDVRTTSGLIELLPDVADRTRWTIVEGPVEHTSATLYEYVDGGADRYLANGFRELIHVRYQYEADPKACVTLDLYDMGTELGAFGIYSAGRRPEYEARPWGAESYRSGTVVAACKGRFFVHGDADADEPELMGFLGRTVDEVCRRISGAAHRPAVVELLPVGGLVARSERYVPADLLGHAFLPGGLLATYEVDGRRSELYTTDLGSDAAATAAVEQLRSHLAARGRIDDVVLMLGDGGFRYHDPAVGDGTVVRAGRLVIGVQGGLETGPREDILRAAVGSLRRGFPHREPIGV